jgi:ACS family sodium-dependent inorganic phosphate cotransporter-like MFS transporter 6/7/8
MIIGCIFNILVPTMAASLGPTGVIICRVIQGLTQGFLFPSVHTLLSKWTPLYERSTMSSVVYAGATLGIVVSMIATGAICGSSLGWPSAFYIYGGCGIVWAVVFVIFAENSPSDHKKISAEEKRYIESSNSISHERKVKSDSLGSSWFKSGCRKYRLLGGRLPPRYQYGQLS